MSELIEAPKRNVVWRPIPGSSQEIALDTRANHTLYCGTRGPGKTDVQLMRFRRRVGVGYGQFWRGVIFDREYKNLDDLVTKAKRWFRAFNDGAEWLSSTSAYKWVWPTGEELLFRSIKEIDEYDDYHGHEYPYIGWNELTKYPSGDLYHMMMSCNRSSFTPEKDSPIDPKTGERNLIPPIPEETFATCNSWGPGHGWVKSLFIDPAPYGQVVKTTVRVFVPATQQEEDVVKTQVAIFGSYKENIYLTGGYIANLTMMEDENLRASWLDGNWDVVAGGAFDDIWKRKIHVVKRFQIPKNWYVDRAFDWGSSKPFSVGWWAESNGEEATMLDGSIFCPPAGSLIQINEWYGTRKLGSNIGVKKSAGDIAIDIREMEMQMMVDEWILTQPSAGPADNQIKTATESDNETIKYKMEKRGIVWQDSDKSPGSRINGMELFRERLRESSRLNGPAIYFMENCLASIATIPVLPRGEGPKIDDVDTDAEDHAYDMTRYRVLKGVGKAAAKLPTTWVH